MRKPRLCMSPIVPITSALLAFEVEVSIPSGTLLAEALHLSSCAEEGRGAGPTRISKMLTIPSSSAMSLQESHNQFQNISNF